jgi:chromosomal replication initiator protein
VDGVVVIPISGAGLDPYSGGGGIAPHPNPLPKGEGTQLRHFPKGEGTQLRHFPKGEGTELRPLPKGEGILLGGFWVGLENRLVAGGVEAILERRSQGSGPVVFFGPCGSGKTHLALGCVSAYRARYRQRSTAYATAVDFARELADAIDTHAVDDFRRRYRRPSLLAIDDVDRLAGKAASERELASTLDAVLEAGGQMLLTSSVAPGELTGFLPQLQSRLISGLTIPLALPGPLARVAIVRRLAELRGLELGKREAETLALGLRWSVPRLSGALATLEAARQAGEAIGLRLIREYLAEQESAAKPSLRDIAAAVSRHFSLRLADLRSPSRRRAVVVARDVAMYLARAISGTSLKQIGFYFSGRDHTTVSHGCWKTKLLLGSDEAIRDAVARLRAQLEPAWSRENEGGGG